MSRARDLSRLSNPTNFTVDVANSRVGLGSTNPTAKLAVSGIVSATAFYGDGSNLEGVASAGLGTALSDEGAASVIYYTDKTLSVTGNTTVDVPDASSSNVAYTQYQEIDVQSGVDFIVADGDEFIPDILGLSTTSSGLLAGGGGSIMCLSQDQSCSHKIVNELKKYGVKDAFIANMGKGPTISYE